MYFSSLLFGFQFTVYKIRALCQRQPAPKPNRASDFLKYRSQDHLPEACSPRLCVSFKDTQVFRHGHSHRTKKGLGTAGLYVSLAFSTSNISSFKRIKRMPKGPLCGEMWSSKPSWILSEEILNMAWGDRQVDTTSASLQTLDLGFTENKSYSCPFCNIYNTLKSFGWWKIPTRTGTWFCTFKNNTTRISKSSSSVNVKHVRERAYLPLT